MLIVELGCLRDLFSLGRYRTADVQRKFVSAFPEIDRLSADLKAKFGRALCRPTDDSSEPLHTTVNDDHVAMQQGGGRGSSGCNLNTLLILRPSRTSASVDVFDGVQRLTALSILFKAMLRRETGLGRRLSRHAFRWRWHASYASANARSITRKLR